MLIPPAIRIKLGRVLALGLNLLASDILRTVVAPTVRIF